MLKLNNLFVWRIATTFVWASVVASGWFWTQAIISAHVFSAVDAAPLPMPPDTTSTVALARLFGATSLPQAGPGPSPADRFVLSGVIASNVGQGAALIAVDGKSAQPFKVGSMLAPGFVLVSVAPREAMLAEEINSPVRFTLTLPLQLSGQSSSAAQITTSSIPGTAQLPTVPTATNSVGSPLATSNTADSLPTVPARADARRQPQMSSRRAEIRTQ